MAVERGDKIRDLFLGLLFDGIGMLSFVIPGIGEFSDIVWAPVSAWLMTRLYKGKIGKVAGVVNFIEEIVPGFDIIPSFTLMWLYTYVFSPSEKKSVTTK
ncbi:hypothetical protein SAMN04487911_10529 [Arenibacter nanhaiticus]|uniref:Uncharacterized protein n=1 Tax=Arenibacter nanhaiticus TaxID=558155 RepID=A0A1M6DJA5_9FLAO|nr:hypothetical protein [Arenibacter nanhaiticus]SHI73139.1 hypothetical protein SAMN04487911_10529 [Arenibacter nanhaiticus]